MYVTFKIGHAVIMSPGLGPKKVVLSVNPGGQII